MSDPKLGFSRERGPRGERGRRGHDGSAGSAGPTGPAGVAGVAPVIAAANVNSGGVFLTQQGFAAGITHTPTSGIYVLTMANPPSDPTAFAVQITQSNSGGGMSTWADGGSGTIIVNTFNDAGVATDRIFSITIYDLS